MKLNKKSFTEIMKKITKENEINKFEIVIWHGDTVDYKNALYIELMLNVNDDEIYYSDADYYDLYYKEDFEDTDDNLKIMYKYAKEFKRKIKTWIEGTWLSNIDIVIKEENV